MVDSSGPVQLGRWGMTLWTWPTTGTFAANRTSLLGNNSAAFGQVGVGVGGVRVFNPDVSLEEQFNLAGADFGSVSYDAQVVTFPVVIYGGTALEAHDEWRRIQAAVRSGHRRAALQMWDPSTSVQSSRWLTNMVYLGASDLPIVQDNQSWIVGNLQFATLGNPWWTPEPIAANEVSELVLMPDTSVHQLYITNPGDEEVLPSIQISAISADVQITLGGTDLAVTVREDKLVSGHGFVEFDRRKRDPEDDRMVTPGSLYFPLPPGESRLDCYYFNPAGGWSPAGNSYVQATFLPNYSTC